MSYFFVNHMKAIGTKEELDKLIHFIAQNRYFELTNTQNKDFIDLTQNPGTIKIKKNKNNNYYLTYDYQSKYNPATQTHKEIAKRFPKLSFEISYAGEEQGIYVGIEKYQGDKAETHQYRSYTKKAYLTAFRLWWNPYQKKFLEKNKETSGYTVNMNSYHKSTEYDKDERYYTQNCTLEYGA